MRIARAHSLESVLAHVPHRRRVGAAFGDEDLKGAAAEAYFPDRLIAILDLRLRVALDLYQQVSLAALLFGQRAAEVFRRVFDEVFVHEFAGDDAFAGADHLRYALD